MIDEKFMVGYRWKDKNTRMWSAMWERRLCKQLRPLGYVIHKKSDNNDTQQTILTFIKKEKVKT